MKAVVALTILALVFATGCATTKEASLEDQTAVRGFLGGDTCHLLKPGEKGEAAERWVNPKAQFTQYKNVLINVVGFFGADASKVSPKDQQALTDFFSASMKRWVRSTRLWISPGRT
jgi:hypothetical protein